MRVKPVGTASEPAPAVPPPPGDRQNLWQKLRGALRQTPARVRFAVYLTLGIAVLAGAGYLVAAIWLFPAPMLATERAVQNVAGMSETEARRDLERHGLRDTVEGREPHPLAPVGTVIWQDPPPGVAVPRGTAVSLILSSGEPSVLVPDVRWYDAEVAKLILGAAGLRIDGIDSVEVKDMPSGLAGGTTPAAGESLRIGRAVMLHLAR